MGWLPWEDVSLYVGQDSRSLRLVVNGYEMPREYAVRFVNGTITYDDIEQINILLRQYQEQMYLHGPQKPEENTAPPVPENVTADPDVFEIPTPESLGLNMNHLRYFRSLFDSGVISEWPDEENTDDVSHAPITSRPSDRVLGRL